LTADRGRQTIDAMNPDAATTETGHGAPQTCVSCGRSTAVGTPFFAGRRVIPPAADDTAAESSYLCEECQDEIHAAARESRMSDEQIREKIASGEIPGMTYKGTGGATGYMVGGDGLGGPS
jgi:ribosomal protein S14